jgi:hypothetical protein
VQDLGENFSGTPGAKFEKTFSNVNMNAIDCYHKIIV